MLAARAYQDEDLLRLEQVDVASIAPTEVLVRVAAGGLTPGLLPFWRSGMVRLSPTTLGHEISGTVEEVGAEVTAAGPGDRVRVHPIVTCRDCRYCRTDREMVCASFSMIGAAIFGPAPAAQHQRYHHGGTGGVVGVR